MRARVSTLTAIMLVGLGALAGSFQTAPPPSVTGMLEAARALMSTLEPEQLRQARLPFDDGERFNWYYTPTERRGLPLKAMTPAQQEAALSLLQVGLSEKGYSKAETIRELETVLFAMSGSAIRDPELYFVTLFGEPSESTTWGWRYEGHHLSHHWTIVNGVDLATSPQFFGSNPASVREGPMTGTRVLSAEEDLGRSLMRSLSPAQRAQALLDEAAPRDILTTNDAEARRQADAGIAYGALTAAQQDGLLSLVEEYAHAQPDDVAERRLDALREAGLDRIRFAWMGGVEPGQGHYYRVQGPTFLIEYDNTQNDANHVHSVWRDFDGDFGRDLLAEHYARFAHRVDLAP